MDLLYTYIMMEVQKKYLLKNNFLNKTRLKSPDYFGAFF